MSPEIWQILSIIYEETQKRADPSLNESYEKRNSFE